MTQYRSDLVAFDIYLLEGLPRNLCDVSFCIFFTGNTEEAMGRPKERSLEDVTM